MLVSFYFSYNILIKYSQTYFYTYNILFYFYS